MIRIFDLIFSIIGIFFLLPLLFIISVCIKLDSYGPVFFKQIRVGKKGKDFIMYKFRTMTHNSDQDSLLTIGNRDSRITNFGYYLRKYKLDEFPQLFNVIKGEMSLVGPRPEVRKYVNKYNDTQLKVLSVKPGITDYASIEYINENEILKKSINPEKTYIEQIIPEKIFYNMIYINKKSVYEYFKILFLTFRKIIIKVNSY